MWQPFQIVLLNAIPIYHKNVGVSMSAPMHMRGGKNIRIVCNYIGAVSETGEATVSETRGKTVTTK